MSLFLATAALTALTAPMNPHGDLSALHVHEALKQKHVGTCTKDADEEGDGATCAFAPAEKGDGATCGPPQTKGGDTADDDGDHEADLPGRDSAGGPVEADRQLDKTVLNPRRRARKRKTRRGDKKPQSRRRKVFPYPSQNDPQCRRSLEYSDFNVYDSVADGRLHRSELKPSQLRCLVQQMCLTRNRRVRNYFVARTQNALWETIRKRLRALKKQNKLPGSLRRRVEHLLQYEFSNRLVRGTFGLRNRFFFKRLQDRRDDRRYTYDSYLYELRAQVQLQLNVPIRTWRWRSHARVAGFYYWGLIEETSCATGDAEENKQRKKYPGLVVATGGSLVKRNNRLKLNTSAKLQKFWSPLADRISSSTQLTGEGTLHHPFKVPVNAKISGGWKVNLYAPPLDPTYNKKMYEKKWLSSEASYQFSRFGLVTSYNHNQAETLTSFYVSGSTSHYPSLLGHFTFEDGYLRFGGGAGYWRDSFKLLEDPSPTTTKGSSIYGHMEFQWAPVGWISGRIKLVGYGNRSEGDLNGWYPSWYGSTRAMLSWPEVTVRFTGSFYGFRRDLEEFQLKNSFWASLHTSYHPGDNWSLRIDGYGGGAKQENYQAFQERWWLGVLNGGYRFLARPELWIEIQGVYRGYLFKQGTLFRNETELRCALNTTLRI